MIKNTKRKKRKNPRLKYEIEEILSRFYPNSNDIKIQYIDQGYYAHAFKLELKSRKLFDNTILNSGKYVLKTLLETIDSDEEDNWKPLNNQTIKRLELLSKYGLIPKIYYIDKYIIIMKYIDGVSLKTLIDSGKLTVNEFYTIIDKARELKKKWEKLGLIHGDIQEGNIIVNNSKIYFIDPLNHTNNNYFFRNNQIIDRDDLFLTKLENDGYILTKLNKTN